MNEYEVKVYEEVGEWKRKINKKAGVVSRLSKKAQEKVNNFVPDKIHSIMTESIKAMVKATLFGSKITTNKNQGRGLSLTERDGVARKKISLYQRTAFLEGAGTGAGGILLGMADFPLLLTIKMKFLFEVAAIYGFDTNEYEERLFILHIFQLAFSSDTTKQKTLRMIENWEETRKQISDMDWRKFQQEYRDYIDLAKMLQLVPGVGAVIGAYANKNLLKHLGETAMNCYRLRILNTFLRSF